MNRVLEVFDRWVQRGPFTPRDLGRYRIVYCVLLFFLMPRLSWLAGYPSSFYVPPTGPFQWLNGFPPAGVLIAIEVVAYLLLTATLFGVWTKASSIGLSLVLMVDFGLNFSVGKVDHSMVMVIVPLILAFARWGDHLSIDAVRRRARGRAEDRTTTTDLDDPDRQPQWPLRLLGFCLGTAFVSAALPKVLGGWLSLSTQASYGYQVRSDFNSGRSSLLSELLVNTPFPPMWEALDWATVALEGLAVLALVTWRSWRIVLAVLVLFHISVGLSLGIWFASNIVVYGAFVAWGRLDLPRWTVPDRWAGRATWAVGPTVALVAVALWWLGGLLANDIEMFRMIIIAIGGIVAVGYLVAQLTSLLRGRRTAGASAG